MSRATRTKARETTPDLLDPVTEHKPVRPLTEGMVRKGGRNQGPSQITKRPPPPAPSRAVTVKHEYAPPNMLAVIAAAAADPACQPDKMRALLDMQKEIKAEEARIAFTRAYSALQEKLPSINARGRIEIPGKSGKAGQSTAYATFNEIHKVTKPILREFGFTLSCAPDAMPDGRLIMRGALDHIEGGAKTGMIVLPIESSGSKNNVQGVGSAISYGKRYLAITLLNLVSHASEDIDDDGQAAGKLAKEQAEHAQDEVIEALTPKQIKDLNTAIDFCGVGTEKFCEKYKIAKVDELPPAMLADAMQACRDFADKTNGAPRG